MNNTEPSIIRKTNWLSVRNELVKMYGLKESVADRLVGKIERTIERAASYNEDCIAFTARVFDKLKEKNVSNGGIGKLLRKNFNRPCIKCRGMKEIVDTDRSVVPCPRCKDMLGKSTGLDPVDSGEDNGNVFK